MELDSILNIKKKYSPIGIDLGSSMVKLLQLQQRGRRKAVSGYAALPTPPGALVNGHIQNPRELVSVLKEAQKSCPWHGNKAALSIDSRCCRLKIVSMPYLNSKELPKAMQYEAEKEFSLNSSQYVTGYSLIGKRSGPNPPVYDYLLASLEKERSDQIIDIALRAGLKPTSLEPDLTADLRVIDYFNSLTRHDQQAPGVLLDLGFSRTRIIILSSNSYQFHRSINIGTSKLIDSNHKKASREAADTLLQEILQALDFYMDRSGQTDNPNISILAFGGGLYLPGLAGYLQKKTGFKINLLNILSPALLPGVTSAAEAKNKGLLYPTAFGLTLRGCKS